MESGSLVGNRMASALVLCRQIREHLFGALETFQSRGRSISNPVYLITLYGSKRYVPLPIFTKDGLHLRGLVSRVCTMRQGTSTERRSILVTLSTGPRLQ